MNPKLAFVGAGRMAGAIVRGVLSSGNWAPSDITCTSAPDGTAETLAAETGILFTFQINELLNGADWIILACKPQQLEALPSELAPISSGKRVLSILAGSPISRLQSVFPQAAAIVRAMPNTPGMIGRGITAYAASTPLQAADAAVVEAILSSLGDVLPLPESSLNAVTGLSGSGPAYVFEFVAALRDAGIREGLDPETACHLALKTVQGAAALLQAVPESPETHRDWVSSPGGTTLAGLAALQKADFRESVAKAVRAARERADELA